MAALLKSIDEQHQDVDLLVNAAGVFFPKPFLEHQDADYDQYMKLNKAFFFVTQKVAVNLVAKSRPGAIVNIGSMWAKQAIAATPSSAYSMAKAGLHSLTQHLAMELASKQIRVNAVSPGSGDAKDQRDALAVRDEMALAAKFSSVRGIGARVRTPRGLATLAPSMLTRLKPSLPALRNSSRSSRCRLCHTCAACQSRRRRQQVMPLLKPKS